jgi:predicted RNA-binding Zn-ribbon protein involved in translation (DUF1610 family)
MGIQPAPNILDRRYICSLRFYSCGTCGWHGHYSEIDHGYMFLEGSKFPSPADFCPECGSLIYKEG